METIALYLISPLAHVASGLILAKGEDEYGQYVVPDQSPAYPQGGGQQSDSGELVIDGRTYSFNKVKWVNREMRHYLLDSCSAVQEGNKAVIHIDGTWRKRNSILHSAGHLVACIISDLFPELIAIKGHHFTDGSYVEFKGSVPEVLDLIKLQLELVLKVELKSQKKIFVTSDEVLGHLPDRAADHPVPMRFVTIESYPAIPCGGTHVDLLSEIPGIEIGKIKEKKGLIKISYSCL